MNGNFLQELNGIEIEKIIEKYVGDKVTITGNGTYAAIDPCPKCGHNDCCRINTESNNIMCFSECGVRYLGPVKAVMWLLGLEKRDAILRLAGDFEIALPENWEEEYEQYLKEKRRSELMTRFAEECHKQLSPEHRKYWVGRGLPDEIIDRFKIGICLGDGKPYNALLDEGYSPEELRESGLFYDDKREYFTIVTASGLHPYFTIPNWSRGVVVDLQGRYGGEDYKEHGLPKYMTMRGTVEQLFNPDALKADELWMAEGIPDTLSLILMEFNASGAYGVNGVKDEWISILRKKKTVNITFDTDEAGTDNAYKLAKRIGDNAKIVTVPDAKDVNELLSKVGAEKAKELMTAAVQNAKTALQLDIEALPEKLDQADGAIMKDIAFRLLALLPGKRDVYIQAMAEHFDSPKRLIAETVYYYKDEWKAAKATEEHQGSPDIGRLKILLEPDPLFHRLSQCFVLNKVLYAQMFVAERKTEKTSTSYKVQVPRVVSSDRVLLVPPTPVSQEVEEIVSWKIDDAEIVMRRPLTSSTMRWSKTGTPYSIDVFLAGKEAKVSTVHLCKQILVVVKKYFFTIEGYDYVLLVLFIMFSYYYEMYDAVPYLYLNGPPESGKTTVCLLLQNLVFNGDLVSNISTAALFREAEAKQMVLIMDEQEAIASKKAGEEKGDYLSIIKDAYKRTGTVKRQSMDKGKGAITEEFQVFNPLVIANVYGLEGIVKTRAIQITTRSASKDAAAGISPLRSSDPEFLTETQLIRDQLYCWVMQNHQDLRMLPAMTIGDELINRAKEIFQPLFALAGYIDMSDENKEMKLVGQLLASLPSKMMKRSAYKSKEPIELLREACLAALVDNGVTENGQAAWVSSLAIFDKLVEVNGQYMSYMTFSWIGDKIASLGWIKGKADKKRGSVNSKKRDPKTGLVNDEALAEIIRKTSLYYLRYELLEG